MPPKCQLLQGQFKFKPRLAQNKLNGIINRYDHKIWQLKTTSMTLQKRYHVFDSQEDALKEVDDFINAIREVNPNTTFSGMAFAIMKDTEKNRHQTFYYYINDKTIHCNECEIRITKIKTEEEKEEARRLREEMKGRTLKKKEEAKERPPMKDRGVNPSKKGKKSMQELSRLQPPTITPSSSPTPQPSRQETREPSPLPPPQTSPPPKRTRASKKSTTSTKTPSPKKSPPPPPHDFSKDTHRNPITYQSMDNYMNLLYEKGALLTGQKAVLHKDKVLILNSDYYDIMNERMHDYYQISKSKENLAELNNLIKDDPLRGRKFNAFDMIFMPLKENGRWSLVVIEYKKRLMTIFNARNAQPIRDSINKFLVHQKLRRCRHEKIGMPNNQNESDSGIYVIEHARKILHDIKARCNPKVLPRVRNRIEIELRTNVLKNDFHYEEE